jgi:hypothetical protein
VMCLAEHHITDVVFFFFSFPFLFCNTGVWTQVLLPPWATPPALFLWRDFWVRFFLFAPAGLEPQSSWSLPPE